MFIYMHTYIHRWKEWGWVIEVELFKQNCAKEIKEIEKLQDCWYKISFEILVGKKLCKALLSSRHFHWRFLDRGGRENDYNKFCFKRSWTMKHREYTGRYTSTLWIKHLEAYFSSPKKNQWQLVVLYNIISIGLSDKLREENESIKMIQNIWPMLCH